MCFLTGVRATSEYFGNGVSEYTGYAMPFEVSEKGEVTKHTPLVHRYMLEERLRTGE